MDLDATLQKDKPDDNGWLATPDSEKLSEGDSSGLDNSFLL